MKRSKPQSPPTRSNNIVMLERNNTRQEKGEVGGDREKAIRAMVVAYLERIEYAHEA